MDQNRVSIVMQYGMYITTVHVIKVLDKLLTCKDYYSSKIVQSIRLIIITLFITVS